MIDSVELGFGVLLGVGELQLRPLWRRGSCTTVGSGVAVAAGRAIGRKVDDALTDVGRALIASFRIYNYFGVS